MPKKKNPETPEEQAERFVRKAQKLADAGLLSPTEGETELDASCGQAQAEEAGTVRI